MTGSCKGAIDTAIVHSSYINALYPYIHSPVLDWGALASYQFVPGSIPESGVICGLSLFLVLVLGPRVFLRVLRFFPVAKIISSKFLFDQEFEGHGFASRKTFECYPR